MKLLKITAVVLLLLQTFRLASLQNSTDSPGRTIDRSWLRERPRHDKAPKQEAENEESSLDYSGIASGSMAINSEEEQNIAGEDRKANETSNDLSVASTATPHVFHSGSKKKHKHPKHTVSPTVMTTNSTDLSRINAKGEFNSTAAPQNSTGSPDEHSTTSDPEVGQNSTTAAVIVGRNELTNSTGGTNATSAPTTAAPDANQTTTTNSSSAEVPPETSDLSPTTAAAPNATVNATTTNPNATVNATTAAPDATANATTANPNATVNATTAAPDATANATTANHNATANATTATPDATANATTAATPSTTTNATAAAPVTPAKSNNTDKSGGSGSSSERGLATDPDKNARREAWGAVLGTAVAVAFVGLVVFIILRKKQQKAFSHRKLVEDFPADPVLRLDNNEPLDLNFGGSAYYNPALQGDNIQMSNIPVRP